MPDKDGDEGKSTKSVVNKKQKQMMGEEGYDIARDMGRVRPSKDKKDATTMPPSKEMKKTQKVNKGPSAFERVKAKYGKSVMKMEELDLTQVAEALGGFIVEAPVDDDERITAKPGEAGKTRKKISKIEKEITKPTQSDIDAERKILDAQQDPDLEKLDKIEKGQNKLLDTINKRSKRSKPPITGDSGQRDRARVTFGQGKELEKKKFKKFFDPKKAKTERERTIAKRKEYEIDDKGNITDRGVDKYARTMKQSNLPPTQQELDKAKEFAVGGKEVKDSKGNVVGTTTGKYGGRMAKQMSPKNLQKLRSKLKADSFIGDKPPSKSDVEPKTDKTTVKQDDKPSMFAKAAQKADKFVKKNPVVGGITGLAAYDIGKGIVGKLMNIKGALPGVRGGTVGRRSARGGGGL